MLVRRTGYILGEDEMSPFVYPENPLRFGVNDAIKQPWLKLPTVYVNPFGNKCPCMHIALYAMQVNGVDIALRSVQHIIANDPSTTFNLRNNWRIPWF